MEANFVFLLTDFCLRYCLVDFTIKLKRTVLVTISNWE